MPSAGNNTTRAFREESDAAFNHLLNNALHRIQTILSFRRPQSAPSGRAPAPAELPPHANALKEAVRRHESASKGNLSAERKAPNIAASTKTTTTAPAALSSNLPRPPCPRHLRSRPDSIHMAAGRQPGGAASPPRAIGTSGQYPGSAGPLSPDGDSINSAVFALIW